MRSPKSIHNQIVKFIALSLCLSVVASAAFSFFYSQHLQNEYLNRQAEHLLQTGDEQSLRLAPGFLLTGIKQGMSLIIDRLIQEEGLESAHIVDSLDQSFSDQCRKFLTTNACFDTSASLLKTRSPIRIGDKTLGFLVKSYSVKTKTPSTDWGFFMWVLLIFTFGFLGMALWTGRYLDKYVRGPLLNLEESLGLRHSAGDSLPTKSFEVYEIDRVGMQVRKILTEYRLKASEAALGQVAAQVAHDIRSPLMALSVITATMKDADPVTKTRLQSVAKRIEDIANDLLQKRSMSVAHQSPRDETQPSPTASTASKPITGVMQAIQQICTELELTKREGDTFKIRCQLPPDLVSVNAEIQDTSLKRVLSNLITNAVEASNRSGIIEVGAERSDASNTVKISVQDYGKGIPKTVLPKLFAPGATFGKARGNGLGLSGAKEVIESVGGSIALSSQEGLGTTVTLEIPILARGTDQPPDAELLIPRGTRIAILDDQATMHDAWSILFKKAGVTAFNSGIRVTGFTNSRELRAYDLASIDLFLSDYDLGPGEPTGIDLIRSHELASKSILVTGRADEPEIQAKAAFLGLRVIHKSRLDKLPIRVV